MTRSLMRIPRRTTPRLRSAPAFALAIVAASSSLLGAQRSAPAVTGTVFVHIMAPDSLPISGATIATGTSNGVTDQSGVAMFTLPTGRRTLHVTSSGFLPESTSVDVTRGMTRVVIGLHRVAVRPDSVIAAQLDGRKLADAPTHVQIADRDAVEEQIDRSPGTVTELLSHMDGVRVQPLSA